MEDQRKMLPELPGETQPDELAIYQMVVNYLLNLSEDYPEPLNLLEYCGAQCHCKISKCNIKRRNNSRTA